MEDCRPMATPMITNLRKLHASEGELVDPTLYHQPVLQTSARRKNRQGPGNIVSGYLGNTLENIGNKSANLKKYKNIQFQL